MKLNVPICQSPIFTAHHWLTRKDRCNKGNPGPGLVSELPRPCLFLCDTLSATHTLPFFSHFSIMLLMAFLVTDYYDPLSEVIPEDKDMQAPYFCQESSLTVQCRGRIYEQTLPAVETWAISQQAFAATWCSTAGQGEDNFWPVFPAPDFGKKFP